jgi:glycosidase
MRFFLLPSSRALRHGLFAGFLALLWLPGAAPARGSDAASWPAFIGWIPLQPVTAGGVLVLDMNRFYFRPPGSEERLVLPETVGGLAGLAFDGASRTLQLAVSPGASGLIEVPLQVVAAAREGRTGLGRKDTAVRSGAEAGRESVMREAVLVVAVQPAEGYTFSYRPPFGRSVGRVLVAGSFNGWDARSHELRPGADGVYEAFVPMPAGVHPYRLVVDGEWMLDPANPEKQPGSTGRENSLARVGRSDRGAPPVVFAAEADAGRATFRLVRGDASVVQVSAVLQRPDGTSRVIEARREGDLVTVDASDAPAGSWVRVVAADAQGGISNAARAPVRPVDGFQWQDGIMYHVCTDRFANGSADNDRPVAEERVLPVENYQGGDFEGLRRKIEEGYFRDLGVNILRLAPLHRHPDGAWLEDRPPFRHRTGSHGRWPVSHTEVEPRFGGEEALAGLISAAHAQGLFVIADLVLRNVHTDHPLWREKPEWFSPLELPDGSKNLRRGDLRFTTWFEEWLPTFDFRHAGAVDFLVAHAVDSATRFRLDGYRLSAAGYIEPDFWWKYRTALRLAVDPGRAVPLYSVGETFLDRQGIAGLTGPNMLDGQSDFPLYDTIIEVFAKQRQGLPELERSLAASELVYGKETPMSPLLGDTHRARFMAYADGDLPHPEEPDEKEAGRKFPPTVDQPQSYEKLKLALTFLLSIDGVPAIYFGDEIGQSGAGDPDNRRMMRWGDEVTAGEKAVREHLRRVAAARHRHPALRYGSRRPLVAGGDRYAFVRAHLGDVVLAVWNRGQSLTEYSLRVGPEMPDGTYVDALGGREIEVKDGRTTFKLEPMTSAMFAAKQD